MSEKPIIVDLDDFTGLPAEIARLEAVKEKVPEFRVTLFTIPGISVRAKLAELIERCPWIALEMHGFMHMTPRECEHWGYIQAKSCIKNHGGPPYGIGWKSPGWLISEPTYAVLREAGYWVADQIYNRARRPLGMRVYELDEPRKIHGHLGHRGGHNANELEFILPHILKLKDAAFGFARDEVITWPPTSI